MKNDKYSSRIYTLAGFIVAIMIAGLIVFGIEQSIKSTAVPNTVNPNQTASSNPNTFNSYAILSPATVPSKVAECSTNISFATNGTSGPITCPNGDLNVSEWKALATVEPSVMTLGYTPSLSQVEAAICSDVRNTKSDSNTNNANLIEAVVYRISALYYGWTFSSDPTTVLNTPNC